MVGELVAFYAMCVPPSFGVQCSQYQNLCVLYNCREAVWFLVCYSKDVVRCLLLQYRYCMHISDLWVMSSAAVLIVQCVENDSHMVIKDNNEMCSLLGGEGFITESSIHNLFP